MLENSVFSVPLRLISALSIREVVLNTFLKSSFQRESGPTLPAIHVEFFGVARSRAKVAKVELDVDCLQELLARIGERFPSLAELCIDNGELAAGWLLNVNGSAFTRDLNTSLDDGDCVLLIPADAGG